MRRQRMEKREGVGHLALNLSLTWIFLLSASSFHSSLPVFPFSLIPPSQRSDPALSPLS